MVLTLITAIILAFILGILAGTLTGLIPGLHINLVAVILLGFSATLLNITTPLTLVIFITAMAITHTFIDFIPSIYLGAPDEDSVLSVLPGHKLLLEKRGHYAVVMTLYGSLLALVIISLFSPIFIFHLPKIYPYIQRIMPIILILVSGYLIITEPHKKIWALVIFLFAGFLGIATFNLNLNEPLLPMLTGLFGISTLIISIKQKTHIPPQFTPKLKQIHLPKKTLVNGTIASIIASPFTAFLPGLGASQAAVIGSQIIEKKGGLEEREFLFLLGAINTIVMGLSFITLYSIQRTRTGAAVAISKLLPELTLTNIFTILAVVIISGIVAFILAVNISKLTAKYINKIKYAKLSIIIITFLALLTLYFTGPLGLLVFTISASLGIFTILTKIRRMHLMGCLLVPTILFYLL